MFKPSPHHLLFKPSDYAVWPITFALSFLHHLLHTQCYCPYAMLYVTKKKDMKKARNQSRSLIFHVRMRIIQNNAGNPNERDEHSKNLKPSPKPSGYLEYSEGCFGIIRIPVSPPTYNPTQPNHPLTLWVSSDDLELDLDRGCINICVNLSFFVVYEYLSWSGGGHEIFMWLADRSFRVFAEMWWLLVEQIERRKRLYFICTTCGRYSVLGKYQMTVDIY